MIQEIENHTRMSTYRHTCDTLNETGSKQKQMEGIDRSRWTLQ